MPGLRRSSTYPVACRPPAGDHQGVHADPQLSTSGPAGSWACRTAWWTSRARTGSTGRAIRLRRLPGPALGPDHGLEADVRRAASRSFPHDLGKILFPSTDEIWFYESKRRMHYWLAAHGMPHPRTWVFYDRTQALDFADRDGPADRVQGGLGLRVHGRTDHPDPVRPAAVDHEGLQDGAFCKTGGGSAGPTVGNRPAPGVSGGSDGVADDPRRRVLFRISEGQERRLPQRFPRIPLWPSTHEPPSTDPVRDRGRRRS